MPQNIRGSDEIIRVPKVIVTAMKFLTEWGPATDFNISQMVENFIVLLFNASAWLQTEVRYFP